MGRYVRKTLTTYNYGFLGRRLQRRPRAVHDGPGSVQDKTAETASATLKATLKERGSGLKVTQFDLAGTENEEPVLLVAQGFRGNVSRN